MTDNLKPNSKAWLARQRRHRHNSYLGHVAMCKAHMNAISESDTASEVAKALAAHIYNIASQLDTELRKNRKD